MFTHMQRVICDVRLATMTKSFHTHATIKGAANSLAGQFIILKGVAPMHHSDIVYFFWHITVLLCTKHMLDCLTIKTGELSS